MKVLLIPAVLLHVVACMPDLLELNQRAGRDLSDFSDAFQQLQGDHHHHHHDHGDERAGRAEDDEDEIQGSSPDDEDKDPTTEELHGGQFCSDLSEYSDVDYETVKEQCCESTFKKNCTEKSKTILMDVTEIKCEVKAWAECKMNWTNTEGLECKMKPQNYTKMKCEIETKNITHIKMEPVCENVTYDNCVTLWDETDGGEKIWTGNEECKPITWTKCELKPKNKTFQVMHSICSEDGTVPYDGHMSVPKDFMVDITNCEVKHAVNCEPVTKKAAAEAKWQECEDVKMDSCEPVDVRKPFQTKIHKKKCLIQQQNPNDPAEVPEENN